MFSLDTIVTDILAGFGLLIIVFSPIYFSHIQRKILNQRLHTTVDGDKLFEKLKYDLKLSKITGINRKRLYRDIEYAKTIFRGAMEYNSRDLIWYFNELYAKIHIHNNIRKKAWMHTWIWVATLLIIFGGSYIDFLWWLFNFKVLVEKPTSGMISIWVLFICATLATAINKYIEFIKIKTVIHDEIRQINLTKKQKVWKDYVLIFYASIGVLVLGYLFIFINFFF